MHDRGRPAAQEGFALVEVLVSLALMAIIALMLVETIRITGRLTSSIAVAEDARQVEAVRDHLRWTLGSLASRRMDGSLPVLQGGPVTVSAVIAADRNLDRPVEIVASFAGAPRTDGGTDLVERRFPIEDLTGTPASARSELLLARVAALSMRYYGSPTKGLPSVWLSAWSRADRQPELIELRIAFGPGDRRRWPPLIVATGERP